jgi:hypothetical protein
MKSTLHNSCGMTSGVMCERVYLFGAVLRLISQSLPQGTDWIERFRLAKMRRPSATPSEKRKKQLASDSSTANKCESTH